MPFLFPAVASIASDILILYLANHNHSDSDSDNHSHSDSSNDEHEPHAFIYHVKYLATLAVIRLLLVLLPFPYHSYTGTAIQGPLVYELFYVLSLVVILGHSLCMIMLDPDSLKRHTWLVLVLSFTSVLLHLTLVWHVRSTAPRPLDLRQHVLYYYTSTAPPTTTNNNNGLTHHHYTTAAADDDIELQLPVLHGEPHSHYNNNNNKSSSFKNGSNGTTNHSPAPFRQPEGYDEFMADLQARLVRTKHQWTARLDDYFSRRMDPYPNSTFGVLLQLFAYQDVLGNGLLDACGESLNPYVPQLLSFLLHGAYDNTLALEEWLLQQCSENVFFAHRCVWFLRAWCLQVSPAPATANNMTPSSSVGSLSRSASSATSLYALDDHSSSTRYAPHERDSVKGLLFRVMERGQLPARQLQLAEGWSATTIANTMMTEQYQDGNTATTAAAPAVQDIVVPIDINGYPNKPHVDSIAATEKFGLLPVHAAKEQAETTDVFMSTPNFLDSLMTMADGLFLVPRERRTEELRIQLQAIELEYLPSNAIYMPVNRVHHWTWRIVAEDSIAISTKERVPCIVILEVVDYNPPPKKNARRRGLLDSFRKDSEELSPATMSLPPVSHDISERDMVQMWRTSARNPYRHSSLLDKVTNFTQDSLKRFRDKNPRDALFWSGDHHIMDLMKPLTRATSFTRDDSREILSTPPGTPVSPYKQPTIPTTAMGQWSSPVASVTPMRRTQRQRDTRKKADDHNDNEEEDAMDALIRIRNNSQRREESQPYGSTAPPRDRKVRPPPVVFKESWETKQERIRKISAYGSHPNWRLLPILIKSNDDLRQEQLASQLIYAMASILAKDRVPVWLCPYEIVALSNRGGIIEAIPDTISIASLKKNDSTYTTLAQFFLDHFDEGEDREDAKANFVESLAAYSIVCFILQIKDRHNGNILLDTCGHLIHIDFGFFFLSSPGKNSGFESAPFKLTREFVEVMDGPTSLKFRTFRELCCRTFLSLRKHCLEIILLVEMLSAGNEELACFRGRPEDAVQGLRERFRLDLNDRACQEYVNALIDESLENWRTRWYDRYQRFCVGVL